MVVASSDRIAWVALSPTPTQYCQNPLRSLMHNSQEGTTRDSCYKSKDYTLEIRCGIVPPLRCRVRSRHRNHCECRVQRRAVEPHAHIFARRRTNPMRVGLWRDPDARQGCLRALSVATILVLLYEQHELLCRCGIGVTHGYPAKTCR